MPLLQSTNIYFCAGKLLPVISKEQNIKIADGIQHNIAFAPTYFKKDHF